MNDTPHTTREYLVTLLEKTKVSSVRTIKKIDARNRRHAVHKALLWFWYAYHGSLGSAHNVLEVADPYNEVLYSPVFRCNDRMNKLLPDHVIQRLISESKGELERDCRTGSRNNPPNSLKRVKRRRDFGKTIAPAITRMKSGAMYYRVTVASEKIRHGLRLREYKYRDVRLAARTLEEALEEIKVRGLDIENEKMSGHKMNVRSLAFTRYVCGLSERISSVHMSQLNARNKRRVRALLEKYSSPRPRTKSA